MSPGDISSRSTGNARRVLDRSSRAVCRHARPCRRRAVRANDIGYDTGRRS